MDGRRILDNGHYCGLAVRTQNRQPQPSAQRQWRNSPGCGISSRRQLVDMDTDAIRFGKTLTQKAVIPSGLPRLVGRGPMSTRCACASQRRTEAIPWLTGAVRRGCTCAAGAVSTYARQDPTEGGPPYRVLRGETHRSMVYSGEAAASARSTRHNAIKAVTLILS